MGEKEAEKRGTGRGDRWAEKSRERDQRKQKKEMEILKKETSML